MITESDERFREAVITFINDAIITEWAVRFTPFIKDRYDVRIYCDTAEDYETIMRIVKERLPNEKFHFFILEGNLTGIGNLW